MDRTHYGSLSETVNIDISPTIAAELRDLFIDKERAEQAFNDRVRTLANEHGIPPETPGVSYNVWTGRLTAPTNSSTNEALRMFPSLEG